MSIDEAVRSAVREELRSVVREELRAALADLRPEAAGEFLTVAEAAKVAAVAPDTLRRWIGAGRLQAHRAGRGLRIARAALEAFMAAEPEGELSPEEAVERALAR